MTGGRSTVLLAAAVLAAGAGAGLAAAPVAPSPAPAVETAAQAVVRPGPTTPRAVSRALDGRTAVVVAFLMPGVADDDMVAQALRQVRAQAGMSRGVKYFVYTVGQSRRFGDLPELLGVTMTPTIVVIGRNRRLLQRWAGLVDADVLRQSISDARTTATAIRG